MAWSRRSRMDGRLEDGALFLFFFPSFLLVPFLSFSLYEIKMLSGVEEENEEGVGGWLGKKSVGKESQNVRGPKGEFFVFEPISKGKRGRKKIKK